MIKLLSILLLMSLAFVPGAVRAEVPILSFDEVEAGMRGTGRTVFRGTSIENGDPAAELDSGVALSLLVRGMQRDRDVLVPDQVGELGRSLTDDVDVPVVVGVGHRGPAYLVAGPGAEDAVLVVAQERLDVPLHLCGRQPDVTAVTLHLQPQAEIGEGGQTGLVSGRIDRLGSEDRTPEDGL